MRRVRAMVRKEQEGFGYRDVWRQGRAADCKKRQRLFGANRPAT